MRQYIRFLVKYGIVVFLISAQHNSWAETKPYFSPSTECETHVVEFLQSATKTVDIAIYSLNNRNITAAIRNIDRKKIRLRILADKLQASQKSSTVTQLHDDGFDIKVNSKYRIQHNKFVVVDGNKVMTGSFNFTEAATKNNAENCVFITNEAKTARQYSDNFEELWQINLKSKSDEWFENRAQ